LSLLKFNIVPLSTDPQVVRGLASLLLVQSPEELKRKGHGNMQESRTCLGESLNSYSLFLYDLTWTEALLPDSSFPRDQLLRLIDDALVFQISQCPSHVLNPSTFNLFGAHICSP
jgi:hypothetical protein